MLLAGTSCLSAPQSILLLLLLLLLAGWGCASGSCRDPSEGFCGQKESSPCFGEGTALGAPVGHTEVSSAGTALLRGCLCRLLPAAIPRSRWMLVEGARGPEEVRNPP